MIISENFSMAEFCRSETAARKGIRNEPGKQEREAIYHLVTRLLQPLRDRYGRAMRINSGYRCQELNRAVGGVPTSQHQKGEAADIACQSPRTLLEELKMSSLDFDQAILYPTFLHLSLKREGKNRRQIIIK